MKVPCVYILASRFHGTLYIGVTSDLNARMARHTQGVIDGFTKRYGVKMLVYYEMFETMPAAIAREKQLKRWNRVWKIRLIEQMNPGWLNLFDVSTGEVAFGPFDTEAVQDEPVADGDVIGRPHKVG